MPFLISCAAPSNIQLLVDAIPNFDTEAVRLDDKNIAVAGHLNCLLHKDTLAKLFAAFFVSVSVGCRGLPSIHFRSTLIVLI